MLAGMKTPLLAAPLLWRFEKLVVYIKSKPGVWFATRE